MVLFDCIMKVVSSFHWNTHCIQITHLLSLAGSQSKVNLWNGWVWGLVIVGRPVIVGRYQARHKVSQSFKPLKLAVLDHFLTWVKTDFRRTATSSVSSNNRGVFCPGLALWRQLQGRKQKNSGAEGGNESIWRSQTSLPFNLFSVTLSSPALSGPPPLSLGRRGFS